MLSHTKQQQQPTSEAQDDHISGMGAVAESNFNIEIPLDEKNNSMIPKVQQSATKSATTATTPSSPSRKTSTSKSSSSPSAKGSNGRGSFSEFMLKTGQKRVQLEQGCVLHKNEMVRIQKEMANLQKMFEQHKADLAEKEEEMKELDKQELAMLEERSKELKDKTTENNGAWSLPNLPNPLSQMISP